MAYKTIVESPIEISGEYNVLRHQKQNRTIPYVWDGAQQLTSIAKGYPLMLGGYAGSGKSELAFEIMLNTSIMKGWKWLIISPETGDSLEIFEYLMMKLSKGYVPNNYDQKAMSDKMFFGITKWMHKHFRILDRHKGWNDIYGSLEFKLKNLFDAVEREEEKIGKFDGILIDPFNELDIDLGKNIAGMVKDELDILIRYTRKHNYLTILTNHANDQKDIHSKLDGMSYFWTPVPRKEQWAYGQQFARKGYNMLLPYRPNVMQIQDQLMPENPIIAQHAIDNNNLTIVYVQKTKPKWVGITGKFYLFYDRTLQRYYEIDNLGMKKEIFYPEL